MVMAPAAAGSSKHRAQDQIQDQIPDQIPDQIRDCASIGHGMRAHVTGMTGAARLGLRSAAPCDMGDGA
jgi:hypothetical protein